MVKEAIIEDCDKKHIRPTSIGSNKRYAESVKRYGNRSTPFEFVQEHPQIAVRLKGQLTHVDVGMVDVLRAINRLHGVVTHYSCQGSLYKDAYVTCSFDNEQASMRFLRRLEGSNLVIEWNYYKEYPRLFVRGNLSEFRNLFLRKQYA
jgi:hypothetical protein